MSKRGKFILRQVTTDSEAMRIEMYGLFGFHHKLIARKIWGNGPKYVPSGAEVGRVGKVLRNANISVREYRNGMTDESRKILSCCDRSKKTPKFKLVG